MALFGDVLAVKGYDKSTAEKCSHGTAGPKLVYKGNWMQQEQSHSSFLLTLEGLRVHHTILCHRQTKAQQAKFLR
jgi:hypothetical protein